MPWAKKVTADNAVCVMDVKGKRVKCYQGPDADEQANKFLAALYASENEVAKSGATVHKLEMIERADYHEGVMIALMIPYPLNEKLALPKGIGEPASELHITLAYLGTTSEIGNDRMDELDALLSEFARANEDTLSGWISGIGLFFGNDDEGNVLWLAADIPNAPSFRQDLVEMLNAACFPPKTDHGFIPHITLAYFGCDSKYDDTVEEMRDEFLNPIARASIEKMPMTFDTMTLAWGNDKIHYSLVEVSDKLVINYPW